MNKIEKLKEKPKYSFLANIGYSIAQLWREEKALVCFVIAGIVMRITVPLVGILTPKIVIDQITAGVLPGRFMLVTCILTCTLTALNFVKGYTDSIIDEHIGFSAGNIFFVKSFEKQLIMDYENTENAEFIKIKDKALSDLSNHAPAANIIRTFSNFLVNIFGLFIYGGIIALIHPLILVVLTASVAVKWRLLRWRRIYDDKRRESVAKMNKKANYIAWVIGDKQYAKDIRTYSMLDWLKGQSDYHLHEKCVSDSKSAFRAVFVDLGSGVLILLRDGGAYAYLTYLLLNNRIAIGDFVLVFAAIGAFAGWIEGIISGANDLLRASTQTSDRREMLEFPDVSNTGNGIALPPLESGPEITLENVSYKYPGAEAFALININVTIKPGERVAVVGVNGAGKTTLVKIICGLYRPTTGRVCLAGRDIQEYNRDEYFSLITSVFQDIQLLAESILENVSQSSKDNTDRNKTLKCLTLAGLSDKMAALPKGADTLLVREVHDDAVDLSGGEKQKLALARALYKNAPVLILDEPTAALDPIAENAMYRQYSEMTHGKTSVYISHRLASTRFCDRILLIDNNTIVEEGSHNDLMKLDGKYKEMFSIQASYYADKEEAEND